MSLHKQGVPWSSNSYFKYAKNNAPSLECLAFFHVFHRTWKNTCQNIKRNHCFVEIVVILLSYFDEAFLLLYRAPLHTTKMAAYQCCKK